ncbi:Transcriptional regulatory protein moc3, partial [Tolypocladium ophioglossoides CBS 100239]
GSTGDNDSTPGGAADNDSTPDGTADNDSSDATHSLHVANYLGQEPASMRSEPTANVPTANVPTQCTRTRQLRRPYTKTKLGCRTCKIRKVRCDETWPACGNCTKTGRACDGVASAHGAAQSPVVTFTAPLTLSNFQPSQAGNGAGGLGRGDGEYLDLFCHELVVCVVGGGRATWRRLVLQAAHEEPALCHAAIAFSALQRARTATGTRSCGDGDAVQGLAAAGMRRLALRHYGRCIQEMQRMAARARDDGRCVNVALLCAVVCICFELRMDEPVAALSHLEHGLSIIRANHASVDADLALAFSRLDVQAAIFLGRRAPALDVDCVAAYAVAAGGGYEEADRDLTCLTSRLFSFMRTVADGFRYCSPGSVPLHVAAEASKLDNALAAFRDRYLAPGTPFADSGPPAETALIRVKHLTATILLAASLAAEEAIYDRFTPQFRDIVGLCAGLIDGAERETTRAGFSLDLGVVHALYVTACKCRHPRVRRRAVRLLDAVPGAEGAWEARQYARIGQRVVQLEEYGLDLGMGMEMELETDPAGALAWDLSRIPEWRRIHAADIYAQAGLRSADVVFRWRPNGMDGEWEDFGEVIAW